MTAGRAIFLRKVHARTFCDEGSDCAEGKNNFGLRHQTAAAGSKRKHDARVVKAPQ